MNIDRRTFTKSLVGAAGSLVAGSWVLRNRPAWSRMPVALAQAASRLSPTRVTKIRIFFPPNWDRNGAQALPQSNMVVLVDTEAGITGVGQGGSPDTRPQRVAERHRQKRVRHRDDLAGRVHGCALFAGR